VINNKYNKNGLLGSDILPHHYMALEPKRLQLKSSLWKPQILQEVPWFRPLYHVIYMKNSHQDNMNNSKNFIRQLNMEQKWKESRQNIKECRDDQSQKKKSYICWL